MRWNYLLPRLTLLALAWVFFAFAFDPLLRLTLLAAGRRAFSGGASLEGVQTTLMSPSLRLRKGGVRLAAGAEQQVVEFDELYVKLAGSALLRKSYVVEDGRLTGLNWHAATSTPLQSSEVGGQIELSGFAALAQRARDLAEHWWEALAQQAEQPLDLQRLETVRVSRQKQADWQRRFDDWQSRARQLEQRFERIAEGINTRSQTVDRLQAYRRSAAEIQQLLDEGRRLRAELDALSPTARRDLEEIDAARQRDLAALEQELTLLRLDRETLTEALLGPELAARLSQAADWLRWIARAARTGQAYEPERGRGIDVVFRRDEPTPAFLVKRLYVDGTARSGGRMIPFSGTLAGLTTEPKVYGRPTVVQLAGQCGGRWNVRAELDHSDETAVHTLQVSFAADEPTELILGDPARIVLNCAAEQSHWQARLSLVGEALSGELAFQQEPFRLAASGPALASPTHSQLVHVLLQSVRQFDADATIQGTLAQPRWRLRSSLGDQLADGLNAALAGQLARQREQLSARVEAITRQRSQEFREVIDGRYGELFAALDAQEQRARSLVNSVAGRSVDVRGLLRR